MHMGRGWWGGLCSSAIATMSRVADESKTGKNWLPCSENFVSVEAEELRIEGTKGI